jgi:hypothetical protein
MVLMGGAKLLSKTRPTITRDVMPDNLTAAQDEYDKYNAAFLRRFYTSRAAAILSSGDTTRISLYEDWLKREAKRMAA